VFRSTLPNETLVELIVSPGFAALNCKTNVMVAPAEVALRVAAWFELTAATVALNPALVAPAATVTLAGSVTDALLLASVTARPPVGAAAVSDTVQASVPAAVIVAFAQVKPLSTPAAASQVPLRLIVAVPFTAAVLTIISEPVTAPVVVGSKFTWRATA
jgi:hypothetical protein